MTRRARTRSAAAVTFGTAAATSARGPRALALGCLLVAGCESFTPPPLAPHVDDTVPLPRGTVMVELVYTEATAGRAIELRPTWQATPDVRGGVGLTLAVAHAESEDSQWQFVGMHLRAARGFATWNPAGIRWGTVTGGVGYGAADTGLRYLTVDGGVAAASGTRPIAGGGAVWFGASMPVVAGEGWFANHPRPPQPHEHTDFPLFSWDLTEPAPKHPAPDRTTRWFGVELVGVAEWGAQPQRLGLALGLLGGDGDAGYLQAALGYGYGISP
ncbi:MAG: hypothetical protein IPL61_05560 [Myxococcales bacterium]|nr:hypothetical protein [Myxococcales bacterium]